jgi:hypothetical protein
MSSWIIWLAKLIKHVLKVVFWVTVVANIMFGGSMRWYFTLIRTLQIIMHLPMARVVVPTCVIYSYSIIIPIAKWDIFEDLQEKTKGLEKDKTVQGYGIFQQMSLLGYDSNAVLDNLDSITIFFLVYLAKVVLVGGLKIYRNKYGNGRKFQGFYIRLKRNLFFYEFYLIIIQPYIEYLIGGYMQFGYDYDQSLTAPVIT